MSRKKSVTLHDLSASLGLSAHTVSKSLRGLPGMSEETRAAVIKAAKQLGYRTKEQERSLAVERIPVFPNIQRRFKLIVTRHTSGEGLTFIHLIMNGLQETLSEYGHSLETVSIPRSFDRGETFDSWAEKNSLFFADGIFIPPLLGADHEQRLLDLPVPRILLNFPPSAAKVDSVIWDVGTAIRQSVACFLANGHRRILFIGNTRTHRGFRLRWLSFIEAMAEAGIDTDPALHVTGTFPSKEEWIAQVSSLLQSTGATAILCAVNYDLAWVYHACSTNGKRIPHDYSLISLENMQNEFLPKLTRPLLPIRETGARGAERMLWRLANPHAPFEHTMLQGNFYEGNTVSSIM
jgi:LacI family transcriptional regulator